MSSADILIPIIYFHLLKALSQFWIFLYFTINKTATQWSKGVRTTQQYVNKAIDADAHYVQWGHL